MATLIDLFAKRERLAMSIERADARRAKTPRQISLRGKPLKVSDADPIAIARAIRRNSALGEREAKLLEVERKLGIR